jgi:amino acid transporter
MRSITTPTTRASARARRASKSPAARALARIGLAARGVIYLLIGWLAIEVAVGHSSRQPNQQGALQLLAGTSYGLVTLWLLGIGFIGYSLWRLGEAAFGVTGERPGAGPRLKSLVRAIVYAFLAFLTFKVISGAAGNETRRQQDITARLIHHTGGQWVVAIVGLVIVIAGLTMVAEGIRRKFMRHLRTDQMRSKTRGVVERLGMIGTTARGLVFAIVGALVIDAAVTASPKKSGGLDRALLTLRHQMFGEFLLLIVALGVLIFGLYGLCEARWRRV